MGKREEREFQVRMQQYMERARVLRPKAMVAAVRMALRAMRRG